MIYTLTLSAAVDLHACLDKIDYKHINRLKNEYYLPGGKGLSVSRMLNVLKTKSIVLGFVGGTTGDFITKFLQKENIKTDFVRTEVPTRINIKINSDIELDFNAPAGHISKKEWQQLKTKLLKLKKGDILIASGSIPKSLDKAAASKVLKSLKKKGVIFIFDTSSDLLVELCKYEPLFIKPNKKELEVIFNKKDCNTNQIIQLAKKMLGYGAKNVLVSLGADGAILVSKNKICNFKAPKGKVVSTVCSGDSMVAAFLTKLLQKQDLESALKYAIAAGSATAFNEDLGSLKEVNEIYERINK